MKKIKDRKNGKVLFTIGKKSPFLVRNQIIQQMVLQQQEEEKMGRKGSKMTMSPDISMLKQRIKDTIHSQSKRYLDNINNQNITDFTVIQAPTKNMDLGQIMQKNEGTKSKERPIQHNLISSFDDPIQKTQKNQLLKKSLNRLLNNCQNFEKSSRLDQHQLNSSFDRINNFYQEYQKFVDFKQEAGWYEEKEVSQSILKNPKFKLPQVKNNLILTSMDARTSAMDNGLGEAKTRKGSLAKETPFAFQTAEQNTDIEGRDKSKIYLIRSELTTAENFFNLQKMKKLNVNHNSIENLNAQAVKDYQNSQSDRKLFQYTKVQYLHNRRLQKKQDKKKL